MTMLLHVFSLVLWTVVSTSMPPRYPQAYERPEINDEPKQVSNVIESFHVKTDIRYRFATTTMTSFVRNTAGKAQEVSFDVTLPKEAFIVHFAMEIDGKTYDGEVKEKKAAKEQYQAAVDRGQSAGHVRQAARHANVFEVSVNVANDTAVNFTLSYQELLHRTRGIYEYELHVQPGQPVEDFLVEVHIQETRPILYVKTPALRTDALITNEVEEDNSLTFVERPSAETASVIYRPSLGDQGESGVKGRFIVQYDVEHGSTGDVLVVDGYFVHFFSPDLPPMPKDIIFVLDLSGSMSGDKISQLKVAMEVILKDLQEHDRFNIITFSSEVATWKTDLVSAGDSDVIAEALSFVKGMRADGMTNINQALLTAVKEFAKVEESGRASLVFFLTDGQPTQGERDSKIIANNVRTANLKDVAIMSLAFGSGADFEALKTFSAQNSGFARKIYEASDAALQVATLYSEVSAVVMKDLSVSYLPESVDEFTLTKREFPVVFNGTEIVICGFMSRVGGPFKAEIKGMKKAGEVDLIFETEDISNFVIDDEDSLNFVIDEDDEEFGPLSTPRDLSGLVERMWAYVTIKQLLKEKEREANNETFTEELKQKIIDMSLKYRLVTPLTSMVVTKPGSDKKTQASLEDIDQVQESYRGGQGGGPLFSPVMSRSHSKSRSRSRGRYVKFQSKAGLPGLADPYSSNNRMMMPMPRRTQNAQVLWTATQRMVTPPTTTTTTTAAQTTTRRNIKVPRGSSTAKPAVLSTLSVFVPNTSVCSVPRKLRPGKYMLFSPRAARSTTRPGIMASMETSCLTPKCRLTGLSSIHIENTMGTIDVHISTSEQTWTYSLLNDPGFDIEEKSRAITIKGDGLVVEIKRSKTKKLVKYAIKITDDGTVMRKKGKRYSGITDAILKIAKPRRSNKKTQAPRICQRAGTDHSGFLRRGAAAKFMV